MSAQEKFDYDLTKLVDETDPESTEQVEDIPLEPVTQVVVPEDTQVSESIDIKDEAEEEEVNINLEKETQTKRPKRTEGKKKGAVKQESKSISRIEEQLKTQFDQNKKINANIRTIQKQLRELNRSSTDFAMHPIVKDLQEQFKTAQKRIVELDRLVKSLDTNQTVIKNKKGKGKKKNKKGKGKKNK